MSYPLEVVLTQLDLHSDCSKNNKTRAFPPYKIHIKSNKIPKNINPTLEIQN
jgi:hypothetical protein